jgi:hypothetical protein
MSNKKEKLDKIHIFEFSESYNENDNPLKACIAFLESCKKEMILDDTPFVMGLDEQPFIISKDRIFKLSITESSSNMGFVDGGVASIINSADFNISFLRVAGVIFRNAKSIPLQEIPEIVECYTVTVLSPRADKGLDFITKFFPRDPLHKKYLPNKDITININDKSIRRGGFIPKIEQFGNIARRFAEWTYAEYLVRDELEGGDILVKDGSLQTGFSGEINVAKALYDEALDKAVIVTGLSKTCRLLTTNGDCLLSAVDLLASKKFPDDKWYYHPLYKITRADNQADIFIVKLHQHSAYPFRFDIYVKQSESLTQDEQEHIIANIASNSNDLAFPGYPYGLIKVDQLSRVSNRELEPHKIQLLSEFDPEIYNAYIKPRIRAVDAHDLLNKIRKN